MFRSGRCVVTIASSAQRQREGSVDLLSIPETARRIGVHAEWRVSVPRLDRYLHGDGTGSYPESDPDSLETAVDS